MTPANNNISIQSKVFKSKDQKARKIEKHRQNVAHRANLHREKASTGSSQNAATTQNKIDALSKGQHL